MSRRPNILFLQTDQQKASAAGPYGNHLVRTPCWDRLAAEGATYLHAYAASPICTPSRASVMTGVSPLVHRVLCHQNHAPENLAQLPELLRAAGYYGMAFGHYEEDRGLNRGWDHQLDSLASPELMEALKSQYHAGSREVGWSCGVHGLPPEKSHAALVTNATLAHLDERGQNDQPWFLHVAHIEPHPPYFAPLGFGDHQDPDRIPMPPRVPDEESPVWQREARAQLGTDLATPGDIRRCVAAYYNMIEYVDQEMQRLLDGLEVRGLLENTWVIASSDHGDYTGEKGLVMKSEALYECLLHVPLVIRGPGGNWSPGERIDDLVELTDLFPTILSLAGVEVPDYIQGRDLRARKEGAGPRRQAVFSAVGEYHGHLKTTMPWGLPEAGRRRALVRGARNHGWSYIRDPERGDEAYDLTRDPHELHNLLQDGGAVPPPVADLQRQLDDYEVECVKLFDSIGVRPGDRNFDSPPNTQLTAAG